MQYITARRSRKFVGKAGSNSQCGNKLWVFALTKYKNVGAGPNRERSITACLVRPAQFKNHGQALKTENYPYSVGSCPSANSRVDQHSGWGQAPALRNPLIPSVRQSCFLFPALVLNLPLPSWNPISRVFYIYGQNLHTENCFVQVKSPQYEKQKWYNYCNRYVREQHE